jgi:hypothetical protein
VRLWSGEAVYGQDSLLSVRYNTAIMCSMRKAGEEKERARIPAKVKRPHPWA